MARYLDIALDQGATLSQKINYQNTNKANISLAGYSVRAQMRRSQYSANAISITATVSDEANGEVTLSLAANVTAAIKAGRWFYDVEANTASDATVIRLVEGIITVMPGVTGTVATIVPTGTTTSSIPEGTNLYFTNARVWANISPRLAALTTSNIAEGANLYFTNARAQASIFNANSALILKNQGVIRYNNVNLVANGYAQMQWLDSANIDVADPNGTSAITNWAYVESGGIYLETNVNSGNAKSWYFDMNGNVTLPLNGNILDSNGNSVLGGGGVSIPLTNVARGDVNGGNIYGYTLTIGNGSQEGIITTPDATNYNAQRLVINPGKGQDGTYGEGGDIYLWAGRGGDTNGNGGDIKIRGGYGPGTGQGGYIRIEAGDVQGAGNPGYVYIKGGDNGGGTGGYVNIEGGNGTNVGYAQLHSGPNYVVAEDNNGVRLIANNLTWQFDYSGNLVLPANSAINYANGVSILSGLGGGGSTGNVTFQDNFVIGTGVGQNYGLYLAAGSGQVANLQYLRLRGGDDDQHIHFDTGDTDLYDLYIGDDNKYVKLERGYNGNIVIGSSSNYGKTWKFDINGDTIFPNSAYQTIYLGTNSSLKYINDQILKQSGNAAPNTFYTITGQQSNYWETYTQTDVGANSAWSWIKSETSNGYNPYVQIETKKLDGSANTWTFNANGIIQFPDNTLQNSAGLVASNININNSGYTLTSGSGNVWAGQSGVVQANDKLVGIYNATSSANNSVFTLGTNGAGATSLAVDGALFVGLAKPSNDGGVTSAFPGWLVVQSGGKFGAGVDTLGSMLVGGGVVERYSTINNANGIVEHDASQGHIFYHNTPSANWTANFTISSLAGGYGTTYTLVVNQGATGYYANAVQMAGTPVSINWIGNTLPVPSTNRLDVINFSVLQSAGGSFTVLGQLTGF